MKHRSTIYLLTLGIIMMVFLINACSKSGGSDPVTPNPCASVTVTVTGNATPPSSSSASDGSITVTATGGSGFTFNINGGTFQSSGVFNNLAAGTYTITAKNSNGCTGSRQFTITSPSVCGGISISLSATTTSATPCGTPNGVITVTASGSTGFTYNINGGTFQSSASFNNLAAGSHTIIAKDANGCTATANVNVTAAPAGPLFSAVKQLMQTNCVSCHNASQSEGGMNWTVECNIVANSARIKARAVDQNPSVMPPTGPLPASEKDKITAWINAGAKFTD
ncbi:MAG: hypothetical protein H0V30_00700 [Chitinophagaceae bacterium]|nr:hypothetical protein [Chitinophagaceae bacterium]